MRQECKTQKGILIYPQKPTIEDDKRWPNEKLLLFALGDNDQFREEVFKDCARLRYKPENRTLMFNNDPGAGRAWGIIKDSHHDKVIVRDMQAVLDILETFLGLTFEIQEGHSQTDCEIYYRTSLNKVTKKQPPQLRLEQKR